MRDIVAGCQLKNEVAICEFLLEGYHFLNLVGGEDSKVCLSDQTGNKLFGDPKVCCINPYSIKAEHLWDFFSTTQKFVFDDVEKFLMFKS